MTQSGGSWPLNRMAALAIGGWIATSFGNYALAQIKPDTTLGPERSAVTRNVLIRGLLSDQIDGGAGRGANLFHSFEEFNIDEGQGAYFTNPAGIENILSRVTGTNTSKILGTLGVSGGSANLFLINPNGIIFGPNSSLDVNGSFVATTASAVQFSSQGFFSASATNAPSLLTVNPSAFLFSQIAARPIRNQSYSGLGVPAGQSLLLLGGDVRLEEGLYDSGGAIYAPGSRVELGGLAGGGAVGLNVDDNNLRLSFPKNVARADVSLTNGAEVNVLAGNGGSIAVNARNLSLMGGSFLLAGIDSGLGSADSKAGSIEVNATGTINLNNSFIANQVGPEAKGQGGDVNISASTLQVKDGAQVGASTFGKGKGGSLRINAQDVQLIGKSADGQVDSGLFASAEPYSTGDAGDLTINTNTLLVKNGARVRAGTAGEGKGGNLSVDAQDVQLIGKSADSGVGSRLDVSAQRSSTEDAGDAGDLTLNTNTLLVKDGAQVSGDTFSEGKGGDLSVDAQNVQVIGESANGLYPSALSVSAHSTGDAGDLTIDTNTLLVRGALVGAATFSEGKGGSLTIDAQNVQVIGRSANRQYSSTLNASAQPYSTGDAGDLTINTNTLLVKDGAAVSVQGLGTGTAGIITLNAPSIRLDDNAAVTANTQSTKIDPNSEQATININSQDLIMGGTSNIFTNATGENVIGGNINIDTDVLAGLENSDIRADSANFRGGNVQIDAQGIFGTEFRNQPTLQSDITATSDLGPQFSGTVELNTPDVDPSQGVVALPEEVVDASRLVTQKCPAGGGTVASRASKFVVTGRGGLPPAPSDPPISDVVLANWITLDPEMEETPSETAPAKSSTSSEAVPIVEAQGWMVSLKGEVILTAQVLTVTPQSPGLAPASCRKS